MLRKISAINRYPYLERPVVIIFDYRGGETQAALLRFVVDLSYSLLYSRLYNKSTTDRIVIIIFILRKQHKTQSQPDQYNRNVIGRLPEKHKTHWLCNCWIFSRNNMER